MSPARKTPGKAAPATLPKRIHSVPVIAEDALAPEETLAEAEREIGLNDWIDPETGEPAEGQSPPRLEPE